MPKVQFSNENIKVRGAQFPKLKLKKGESARLLVLEAPESTFVHTLQAPVIEGGVPLYETKKRKNNSEYQDNVTEFVAKTICQGDYETLSTKGSDPEHCAMCKAAEQGYGKPPQQRYAMNVIRYRTRANSNEVVTPFSVEVVTWEFGDRLFNDITSLAVDWAEDGGLKKHDLVLGPCTNENFQQADLNVLPKAAWLASEDTKKRTAETFKENRIDDLELAMGSKKEPVYVNSDVARVVSAWKAVNAYTASGASAAPVKTLDEGIEDLLDAAPKASVNPAQSIDDLFATDDEGWAVDPEAETVRAEELPDDNTADAEESSEFSSAEASGDDELDDLLAGL